MIKKELINSIFYPRKSFSAPNENDLLIQVEASVNIGVRLFLDNKSNANVLYFHGNAELAQEYNSTASLYNNYNINLIVADYRGYGLSDGSPDRDNLHSDAVKIFDYIAAYLKDNNYNGKIIIMGRSLGSASACEIISKREESIDKCIIESGFATEYSLLRLMNVDPDAIDYSLSDGFQNLSKLEQYKKPIYFIHADMDDIIPLSEAKLMLKESGSKDKELFIAEGTNHNNIIIILSSLYFKKIQDFIYK